MPGDGEASIEGDDDVDDEDDLGDDEDDLVDDLDDDAIGGSDGRLFVWSLYRSIKFLKVPVNGN